MSRFAEPSRPTSAAFLGAMVAVVLAATFPFAASARDTAPLDAKALQRVVDEAYAKFKDLKEGANANYIPILDTVPSDLYGVAIVTKDGKVFAAGDVDYIFSIQSVAKPFNAALIMQEQGPDAIREKIGVEPTGLPFNSKLALEIYDARSVDPLVNAGAIAAVSMVKAENEDERWQKVLDNLSEFAGDKLKLLPEVNDSEYSTAWSNRAIANLLYNYERLYSDPEEALIVYTKMSSVGITTAQLATMGATLANGGKNPKTGARLLDEEHVPEHWP